MPSLISPAEAAVYQAALDDVFDTFKRQIVAYLDAQTAVISTSVNNRFAQHDQNVFNPAVTPQPQTIYACIRYGNKQDDPFLEPYGGAGATQLKLRDTDGMVRIKVEADGYAILRQAKQVTLDGFQFIMTSVPRPHGLIGAPSRWTFTMQRQE